MKRVVFSTEVGKVCPECQQAIKQCHCQQLKNDIPLGDGIVRIQRETKGRKGKGVTLISGLPLNAKELKTLAKELKQRCSTGGAIKQGVVEIQGDHRELLKSLLESKGYAVKISGG
ncbi:translation initiation factor Sui1 [Dasania sp. GY-MA-18]|uniref:Translation initiation factor Sui1 n=1 Tax=Dasania phycosphaerae TaxID=2950436 RepID=A0A9J6RND8_9GAMM|nr:MULTISPECIES: translation initiation factor Sui1 [Dasania]MCR8923264.1 translation initiation factor Sui1 [Dasania sp. GY-MA-18]MCZ0865696.1 translation initiation factor Sui1 [Dasania phycosphaerae]MCZ0869421.1 translation initiation factor Sui1 [Dasania phycosphaerae]